MQFTQPTLGQTFSFDPCFGYFGSAVVPVNTVLGSVTENADVYDVGGGVNFPLPRTGFQLYLEARHLNGLTGGTHTRIVPITFGIRR